MSDFGIFFIHLIVYCVFFGERCAAILVTEQQQSKPSYTPGIKTVNWKNPILTHQNYSRVNVHNKPDAEAQYFITRTEETQNIYPVYNAHSYGPRSHQNVFETKSHTDIDTGEFSKPNRTIFKRKIEYKSLEVYEKCPTGATGQFVYSSSCNQFLNCWKGRGAPQTCAPGTLFNPKTLECDFPEKVECITGPRQNTLANSRVPKSVRQVNCPEGFSGLIPNYTDCSKFISCSNGQPFPMDCPPGTLFDTNQNICDHPNKCTCFNGQSGSEIKIQLGQQHQSVEQNQGRYQTFHGQNQECHSPSINCGQNTQAHNQFGSSTSNTQYTSQQHGTNQNPPIGYQQSITRLYPVDNLNHGLGTLTVIRGQSNCNPRYENCLEQNEQSQGISHGQKTGYHQSTIRTSTGIHGDRNQGKSVAYGQTNYNLGYATSSGPGNFYIHTSQNKVTQPNCNPSSQNCAQDTTQGQGYNRGYGQTIIHSHSSDPYCNPSIQNCGQIVRQSQDSSVGYAIGGGNKCNPSTQNCHPIQGTSSGGNPIYDPGENCNPSIQNCRPNQGSSTWQGSGSSVGQTIIHTSGQTGHGYGNGQNCNPFLENCGQNIGQGSTGSKVGGTSYTTIRKQGCIISPTNNCDQNIQHANHRETVRKFPCDPQTQLCGQSTEQSGITIQGSSQTTQNRGQLLKGAVQVNCDLSAPNCGQNSGYEKVRFNGHTTGCDPLTLECDNSNGNSGAQDHTIVTRRTSPKCPDDFQGLLTHPGNCKKFLNCSNGRTLVQDCAPGTLFNPTLGNCDFPYNVDCRSSVGTGIESSMTYGVKLNGQHGENIQEVRPNGQYHQTFHDQSTGIQGNQNQHQSVASEQSNLGYVTSPAGRNYNIICNINDKKCTQGRTIATRPTEPKCPDDFQGLTRHPSDCKKFLSCANGRTFIQDCAPGTLFNPTLGNCDFPYNVDCQSSEGTRIESSTTHGVEWNGQYGENIQEVRPNDNIRPTTEKTKKFGPTETGSFSKWNNINIYDQNTITETNNGEIGLVSRPLYPSTTERNKQNIYEIGRTLDRTPDYIDIFDPKEQRNPGHSSTTSRSVWPPPFPKDVSKVDYVFDYEDGESVTLDPDDILYAGEKRGIGCEDDDFHCSIDICISQTMVCNGHRDCENGKDEQLCEEYIARFTVAKNSQLVVLENQRWVNASYATCAMLCIQNTKFTCRSFNYRKIDRTCFLSDKNIGLTGALRKYFPTDYYELNTGTIDCSDHSKYFECSNKKCLLKQQVCDGADDCGDRQDEKKCKSKDFGYSIKLGGSEVKNEGRIEVTAFGKTGYICDDQFGIQDANVVCRELGFKLGAIEVKGQSYFAKDLKESNTFYMMDEVECFGNETTLLNCGFAGWGIHNCRDQEIAGLVCKTSEGKCKKNFWRCDTGNECVPYDFVCDGVNDCTDDSDERSEHCEAPTEIRLANGPTPNEGRLEIKHHGIWGTVCDDDFNEDAAKVVCKYFGFKGKSTVKKDAYFGEGHGPIWLDQVSCLGNETLLEKCTHWNWGEHNCEHNEDVGVICSDEMMEVEVQRNSKIPIRYETGLPEKCGFRKDNQFLENDLIQPRVVSGSIAKKGDYPWQAALKVRVKEKSAHWCGAVIISSKWVLTAAHCLQGYTKGAYIIVAGEYNTDEDEGTEQHKYIEEFFVHEKFRRGHKMNNDIALIKVKGGGFALNDDVQPICLPHTDVSYDQDLNCTISGFGSVKSGTSAYSHNMMAAWIPIHSNEICKMPHIYGDEFTDGMFCAGFLDGGIDACDGDSGGPLACLDQGYYTLYGLTSWGQHCGYANKPGVYVKVAYYRPWIEDIIQRNSQ